jgi:hypothetical protein
VSIILYCQRDYAATANAYLDSEQRGTRIET